MPRLRENQQPDAVIDLRHGSLHRAPTDAVVLVDDELPELVFTHEPVLLDAPGGARKKRRVAELEEIATTNARAAHEARAIAIEQRQHLEAATTAWRATEAELTELRRELKQFASARADLIAKERARAEQTARTDVGAELLHTIAERDELQTEVDRLRVALTDQQSVNTDSTYRVREEQRDRAAAEKEAKRAIAAYETAERRLEAASDALRRSAADEQARIEVIDAARAEAVAELEALGGAGQVARLTNRIEDLVNQLAELDGELMAMQSRAELAEAAAAVAANNLAAAGSKAEAAEAAALHARREVEDISRERDTLREKVAELEEAGDQWKDGVADAQAHAATAEAGWNTAAKERDHLAAELADRDGELSRAVAALEAATSAASEIEAALTSARSDADAAQDRATFARVRLDEILRERDALLDAVAGLERAADERGRAPEAVDSTEVEQALVAARFDAETLRGETTALAAQLEEARSQIEAARRAAARRVDDEPTEDEPTEDEGTLLDALSELAAQPEAHEPGTRIVDDDVVDDVVPDVRIAPPAPKPEDPDARRAALGYLNALARDVPMERRPGT